MTLQRWVFFDPIANVSHTIEMNPADVSGPNTAKTIGYAQSAGPGGSTLIYEGREVPADSTFSGTILTEAHYTSLRTWYRKRVLVTITDDLGRVLTVYIKAFKPKRVRSAFKPWKHTFDMDVIVLDETLP